MEPGPVETGSPSPDGDPVVEPASHAEPTTEIVQVAYPFPRGATPAAIERYKQSVRKFAVALTRETSRLEEAHRIDDEGIVEITTSMVATANELIRNPPQQEPDPPSNFATLCPIIAAACWTACGIFGSYSQRGCGAAALGSDWPEWFSWGLPLKK